MAIVAGLDLSEYASAPTWKRIYMDAAMTRSLELQMQLKDAEVKAIGAAVGHYVAKLFSK